MKPAFFILLCFLWPVFAAAQNAPVQQAPLAPASGTLPAPPNLPAAPVSPAVPSATQPLDPLAPTVVPPLPGDTLPAAAPPSFAAQTPNAVPLTLTADEAVALAARKNLGLLAALRDILAARRGVSSAHAFPDPLFTIGPALETGGTTDGLLFQQPLEINGVRQARTHVAQAQLRLAQAQALVQLQDLAYTARENFYALARAQAQLALQQELLTSAEQFEEIARRQVALGARPAIEQTQAAIETIRARQLAEQAQGEQQAALAALNAYLGRAPLDPVDTSRGLTAALVDLPPVDPAAAQKQALIGRGEIAAAEASRDIPAAQAALLRAQNRPDIAPDFRINQITPTYQDAGVGVVITIPLDYGARRSAIEQKDQAAQGEDDRVDGTQAQVRLEAEQAAARLSAARAVLAEYDAGLIADARKVLDDVTFGYKAGRTTIIDVLAAQRTFREISAEQINAQDAVADAQAALDRATGALPPAALAELTRDFRLPTEGTSP